MTLHGEWYSEEILQLIENFVDLKYHAVQGGFMETTLIHMDVAKKELAKVTTIDEAKGIRDKAEALRVYAKQTEQGLDIQNQCAEIKIRAERKAGEILADMEKHKPGPTKKDNLHDVSEPPKLSDLGIS